MARTKQTPRLQKTAEGAQSEREQSGQQGTVATMADHRENLEREEREKNRVAAESAGGDQEDLSGDTGKFKFFYVFPLIFWGVFLFLLCASSGF